MAKPYLYFKEQDLNFLSSQIRHFIHTPRPDDALPAPKFSNLDTLDLKSMSHTDISN